MSLGLWSDQHPLVGVDGVGSAKNPGSLWKDLTRRGWLPGTTAGISPKTPIEGRGTEFLRVL
jgi:hypothetical protein